jgi:hypothetical protein
VELTSPPPAAPCLSCRERVAHCRGLCNRCYTRAGHAVRSGETTWAALVAAGLALPARPAGRGWRHWEINPCPK